MIKINGLNRMLVSFVMLVNVIYAIQVALIPTIWLMSVDILDRLDLRGLLHIAVILVSISVIIFSMPAIFHYTKYSKKLLISLAFMSAILIWDSFALMYTYSEIGNKFINYNISQWWSVSGGFRALLWFFVNYAIFRKLTDC